MLTQEIRVILRIQESIYSCSNCGGMIQITPGTTNVQNSVMAKLTKHRQCPYCHEITDFFSIFERALGRDKSFTELEQ